jgi:hypothetical protein
MKASFLYFKVATVFFFSITRSGAPSNIGTTKVVLIRSAKSIINLSRVESGTELNRLSKDNGVVKNFFDGAFFPVGVSSDLLEM